MLDKLRIALVLLVIGTLSGLLIWGTHALTYDRILENRERARLAVFVDMFPEVDVTRIDDDRETISNSLVKEKILLYNSAGTQIGTVFIGSDNNAFGFVDVVIGIAHPSNEIVNVVLTDYSNTETYVRPLVANYIVNLSGQPLTDVSYDVSTGATATYNSVRAIIEAAKILVAGDPVLETYQSLFGNVANRYVASFTFSLGVVKEEINILNAADDVIGRVYQGTISVDDEDVTMGVGIGQGKFLGFYVLDDAPSALTDAIALFDTLKDTELEGIDFDTISGNALVDDLKVFAQLAALRAVEDEELRDLREYFLEASSLDETIDIDHNLLVDVSVIRDAANDILGYVYIGEGRGYAYFDGQPIVMAVVINADGQIHNVVILEHNESRGFREITFDQLHLYIGLDDINDFDFDVYIDGTLYAGPTNITGQAVYNVVEAALADYNERYGD